MAVGANGFIRTGLIIITMLVTGLSCTVNAVSLSIPPLMTAPEMLAQLNQQLILTKNSPAALHHWCRGILEDKNDLVVTATATPSHSASQEIRALLQVNPQTDIAYIKLKYQCQNKVIAVFEHWYLPQMLPAKVKAKMAKETVSFGRELRQFGFYRQSISNRPMWPDSGALPAFVLQHQAILYRNDKKPFSVVIEHYTRQLLPNAQQLDQY